MERHQWQPPVYPLYKLNTDGTWRPKQGFSGAGGLIRDSAGKYLVGFLVKLNLCSSSDAEWWGAYHGLSLAWNRGFKRILLEIDNEGVASKINEIIERKVQIFYPADTPMDKVQRLLGNDWEEVKVISILGRVNKCADRLAELAVEEFVPLVMEQPLVMEKPPDDQRFQDVLLQDSNGVLQQQAEEEGSGHKIALGVGKAIAIAAAVGAVSYGLASLFTSLAETSRKAVNPWYKLNTDGTRQPKQGFSGAGGLIRDYTGKYLVGFLVKLKLCNSSDAEWWGAYHGLSLAWDRGFKRIILEIDNDGVAKEINKIIERKGLNDYPADTPKGRIQRLLGKAWEEVKVVPIPRNVNKCADRLADMAVEENMPLFKEQPLVVGHPLVMKHPPADKRFKEFLSEDSNDFSDD